MAKTYRPYAPEQTYLLPPSPHEWLSEDHLAYFVLDLVRSLDVSAITSRYEREERGFPPHHPRMMLALLIYGYMDEFPISRRWRDIRLITIGGGTSEIMREIISKRVGLG